MLLNSKLFNQIDTFLGGYKEVDSLEEGSRVYGGATQVNGEIYSNCEGSENIRINKDSNKIALFIPSTTGVDNNINNKEYVNKYYKQLHKYFNDCDILVHSAKGGWYSDDLNKVIIEDIIILEVVTSELKSHDIEYVLNLGIDVKKSMTQESVSVVINNQLALV